MSLFRIYYSSRPQSSTHKISANFTVKTKEKGMSSEAEPRPRHLPCNMCWFHKYKNSQIITVFKNRSDIVEIELQRPRYYLTDSDFSSCIFLNARHLLVTLLKYEVRIQITVPLRELVSRSKDSWSQGLYWMSPWRESHIPSWWYRGGID